MPAEYDKKFFSSTRGKIILSLRDAAKTVNDLAAEFGLTDNAVRAHLLSLERDRLVEQSGMAKGYRKPHFLYHLTADANRLFPKAYDSLLSRILSVFKRRLQPTVVEGLLEETGREIGSGVASSADEPLESRLDRAIAALSELGGSASIVDEHSRTMIKSNCCPFGEVVKEHPEVCKLAESLVSEIVGEPVEEKCDRGAVPKCRFELKNA
jgi:predicted ArsR family transcriptional regulator